MSAPFSQLPAPLARVLDQVRHRHLAIRLAEFPVCLLAALAVAWSIQGVADRVFDLSWNARCAMLVADGLIVLALLWRFVVRPLRQRFDRKAAALFVERGIPEFRTSLISAVELSADESQPHSRPLVAQLMKDVTTRLEKTDVVAQVVKPDRVKRLATWMALPFGFALALFFFGLPVSGLVMKRIFLSNEAFPAQTTVVVVTRDLEIEEGGEVALTARAQGVVPPEGRLVVTRPGKAPEVIPVAPSGEGGEFTQLVKNVREPFGYHFELNDGVGPEHRVTVLYPPSLKELRFVQVYPGYTKLPETEMRPTSLKLLEGSKLRVEGVGSKPLRGGSVIIKTAEEPLVVAFQPGEDHVTFRSELAVPGAGWKNISVHLDGREGDGSLKDPVYPVQLVRDRPPFVTLLAPKQETLSVVATATIPVAAEATDDFGLTSVTLYYRVLRPKLDGSTEEAESGRIPFELKWGERTWKHALNWNIGRIVPAVTAGCNIVFWIEANDNNGAAFATGRSAERTIRVVSEEQKRAELLEEIARKAADIERLYQQQRAINVRTDSAVR